MSKDAEKKDPKPQHPGKGPGGGGGGGGKPEGKKPGGGGGGGKPKKGHAEVPEETGPKVPPRLRVAYETKVREGLKVTHGITNPMQMPRLQKIVLNVNMGRHLEGTKVPPHIKQQIIDTLTTVSGQKPIVIRAKKSVSNFKLRAGFESSVMVTMRRERMWHFLDRLINLATPRIKDFRGLPDKAFDRRGNYSFGVTEQGIFPEINMAEAAFTHGMHLNFVFSSSNAKLSRFVLEELGMPFRKPDQK
ncbi:MAG: 50S ribosomal protein L5 [Phycisphaerales bacterium]|nr:50S ribosomal protein L5 [Phycisphaerales bacterium]